VLQDGQGVGTEHDGAGDWGDASPGLVDCDFYFSAMEGDCKTHALRRSSAGLHVLGYLFTRSLTPRPAPIIATSNGISIVTNVNQKKVLLVSKSEVVTKFRRIFCRFYITKAE